MTQAPTAPPSESIPTAASNPFPGPRAYDRDNRQYFFGRDEEIEELTSLVLTSSATLLYAPSGAGKSSLLRAGVAPVLERDFDFLLLPTVHFGTVARGDSTRESRNSFVRTVCESIASAGGLEQAPEDIGALAARERGESSRRVLLVLDQFEDVLNDPSLWQQREEFFHALTRALDAHPWLRTVIALRSDYLADLGPYEHVLPGRLAVRYQLDNLTEKQATEAIRSAFDASGAPLSEQDLARLLDLLLEDAAVPHVRAQYVNTIQLQIVCRRLWQDLREQDTADTPVLGSGFSVRETMLQFVDGAIAEAVSKQGGEAFIRWWLESHLITSAARRAFVLIENRHAAGLPIDLVESLATARLLHVEQRHGQKLVELTHDSMVDALQASNGRWRRATARRDLRVTLALAVALLLLVAAFPFLQAGHEGQPQTYGGPLTDQPAEESFVGTGQAVTVVMSLSANSPVKVTVVERLRDTSAGRTVASQVVRAEETPVPIPVRTRQGANYRVRIDLQGPASSGDNYDLSFSDLPLGSDTGKGRAVVSTTYFGIPLSPGKMTMLSAPPGKVGVSGVDVLAQDLGLGGWAILQPADASTIAVVSLRTDYLVPPDPTLVTWQPLGQPAEMQVGKPGAVQGGRLALGSFTTESPDPVLGVQASCSSSVHMSLVGAGNPTTAVLPGSSPFTPPPRPPLGTPPFGQGSFAVLPLYVQAGRHVVLLTSDNGGPIRCTLTVRSFGGPPLSDFGAHDLVIDDDAAARAYSTSLPADAVLVAAPQTNIVLGTVCRDPMAAPSYNADSRILTYIPRDGDCAVWVGTTDPSRGLSLPIWLVPAGPGGGD